MFPYVRLFRCVKGEFTSGSSKNYHGAPRMSVKYHMWGKGFMRVGKDSVDEVYANFRYLDEF
eukprot:gene53331-484_t